MNNREESVQNGLLVAVKLGLPSLRTEANDLREDAFRSGKCSSSPGDCDWKVRLGQTTYEGNIAVTSAQFLGYSWSLLDYGDTIPQTSEDPINDRFGKAVSERNQCPSIHLAAGGTTYPN